MKLTDRQKLNNESNEKQIGRKKDQIYKRTEVKRTRTYSYEAAK